MLMPIAHMPMYCIVCANIGRHTLNAQQFFLKYTANTAIICISSWRETKVFLLVKTISFELPLQWTQTYIILFQTLRSQYWHELCKCAFFLSSSSLCLPLMPPHIRQSIDAAHDYMISAVNHNFKCDSQFFIRFDLLPLCSLALSFSVHHSFATDYFLLLYIGMVFCFFF